MNISESLTRKIPDGLKPLLRVALRAYRMVYGRAILLFQVKRSKTVKFMNTDDYEEWYYNRPQAKKYLNDKKIWINLVDMIHYFEPNSVLDFGCGLGNVLKEARKRNVNIIGCETSRYAIRNSLCKERVVKTREIPKSKLPFKDNSFDLVFSAEVMEHVKETDTEAVIKELNRICSNYALLTINTFDYKQPGHINVHPRKWWLKKFENEGFKHDDKIWADLNKIKYLQWDIYVFKKINIIEAEKE